MRRVLGLLLILLGFGGAVLSQGLSLALAAGPHVALVRIDEAIQPITARFLSRAIDSAAEDEAELLIVQLDTPGGLFDSTRDMVEKILDSPVPVVVFVAPSGAHAASAGTFVTAAAHVAAMAPVTNIGAASPVSGSGGDLPETLERKATQDAAAFLRDIARERGRNLEALEATVLEAISYSAAEALEENIIDLIAEDMDDLLAQLDGRTVQLRQGAVELQTAGLEIREIEPTRVERFLNFIADPNIAFTLLTLGVIGIFVEYLLPGLWGPGILGVMALALGLVALGNLPVNWVGAALMAFGAVLLAVEMHSPGFGIFGVSGGISFVIGAFLLFGAFTPPPIESPTVRVNPVLILSVFAAMLAFLVFVVRSIAGARAATSSGQTSALSLVGHSGLVTVALAPSGSVDVAGEEWTAVSDSGDPIPEGEEIIVLEAEGLTLKVFKAPDSTDEIEDGTAGEELA